MLTNLKNFEIKGILGQGAMGVVYEAVDKNLERKVAIKVVYPHLANDEIFLTRFRIEAKALAKLIHRNIVYVNQFESEENQLYIVMEYIAGKTLKELIQEKGKFPPQNALKIFFQVLDALEYAHRRRVLHRDIKPANIMVNNDNVVKITDFGLAKIEGDIGITGTRDMAGTLYYMSPEQIDGFGKVDSRADIYSTGMTFYEMLAGRLPFNKKSTRTNLLYQITNGQLPPIREFDPKIDHLLSTIISKAIHKDREKRYQTAKEFKKALDNYNPDRIVNTPEPADFGKTQPMIHQPEVPPVKKKKPVTPKVPKSAPVSPKPPIKEPSGFKKQKMTRSPEEVPVDRKKKPISRVPKPKPAPPKPSVPARSGKPRFKIIPLLIGLLFIISLGLVIRNIDFTAEKGSLSVTTTPGAATITLDNRELGEAPLKNIEVKAGLLNLHISKDGYLPTDTTLQITANQNLELAFQLKKRRLTDKAEKTVAKQPKSDPEVGDNNVDTKRPVIKPESRTTKAEERKTEQLLDKSKPVDELGSVLINSNPPGAQIIWNRKKLSQPTPFSVKAKKGTYSLVLSKKGYAKFEQNVRIKAGRSLKLQPVPNLIALQGTISILTKPYGTIYINGKLKARDRQFVYKQDLDVGRVKIKITNAKFTEWEKQVEITESAVKKIVVDFNAQGRLTVIARLANNTPTHAENIQIDGEWKNVPSPKPFNLHVGKHRINVKKAGYKVQGGSKTIQIEKDQKVKLVFIFEKL